MAKIVLDPKSAILKHEAISLARFLHAHKTQLNRSLEIGFASGLSTIAMILVLRKPHIAIDPFQDEYGNLGLRNVTALGLDKYLTLMPTFSHHALPDLLRRNETFDLIFIDGDHRFDTAFVDTYFSDQMLNIGGYLIFHDAQFYRGVKAVNSWLRTNKHCYRQIPFNEPNITIFQKTQPDNRHWTHSRPFMAATVLESVMMVFKFLQR